MLLVVFLSVITVCIVIVPILIFMCTENDEEPSTDYEYKKDQRKKLDIKAPTDDIQNFEDNPDEISTNAIFHAGSYKSNGKNNSKDPESPEGKDDVGFNISKDIRNKSDSYS